jgi:hypothetical protein
MSLVRSGSLILVVSASLLTVACGASSADDSSALTPAKQGETSSELVLSKVDNAASVEIAGDDGACTALPTLVEANKDKLTSLCAEGQVPVPVQAEKEGCDEGSVTKVTFACLAVNFPPIPQNQCIDIPVRDNGAMAQGLALDPGLVCARIGGAPPPFAANGMQGQPNGAQGCPQGPGGPIAGQPGIPGQPGQLQPGQLQPGQAQPGQPGVPSQPGQVQPGQVQPGQAQPGQAPGGSMPPSGGAQGGSSPFPPGAIHCCALGAPANGR